MKRFTTKQLFLFWTLIVTVWFFLAKDMLILSFITLSVLIILILQSLKTVKKDVESV